MTLLICGAGIAGLTMGLTLHQIGVPFQIFETVSRPKPLGVGINLQPPPSENSMPLDCRKLWIGSACRPATMGFIRAPALRYGPNRAGVGLDTNGRNIPCIEGTCRWRCSPPCVRVVAKTALSSARKCWATKTPRTASGCATRWVGRPGGRRVRWWSALTAFIRRYGRACIRTKGRPFGAARSCGGGRRRPGRF